MQRQSAKMTKSETRQDGAKARALRDKGQSFVGKTVTFQVFHYNPTRGGLVSTGKQETGTVERWDDVTQSLQVRVDTELMLRAVKLEHLVGENKNV